MRGRTGRPATRRNITALVLRLFYLLTCRVLDVAVLVFRGDRAKAAELLALRHENAVLRRHVSRVGYGPPDRLWSRRWRDSSPQALDRDLPRDACDAARLAPQTGYG